MDDVYEIARAGLELAEKATPGEWHAVRGPHKVCDQDGEMLWCWGGSIHDIRVVAGDIDAVDPPTDIVETTVEIYDDENDYEVESNGVADTALIAHAGTHYAALCRAVIEAEQTRLAQKAVVEAAVEQERQRFLADESRAARQDLETQAQHTEDYRSACRTTNAAVRAMKEQR